LLREKKENEALKKELKEEREARTRITSKYVELVNQIENNQNLSRGTIETVLKNNITLLAELSQREETIKELKDRVNFITLENMDYKYRVRLWRYE
jgi:hypothetical protein